MSKFTQRFSKTGNMRLENTSSLYVPIIVQEALVKNDLGTDRINEPVTIGIPLAEDSGITSINEFGLQNVSAGQFRILDRWHNGNIKWILADFQTSLNAGETKENIALINGAGNFGGNNLATEDDNYIYINTGIAQFTIKKYNFNMFDEVVVNDTELVSHGNNGGLYIQGEEEVTFSSVNDPNSEVIIEEDGSVRAVIKAMGAFTDSASNELMWYTVRMHFYKDKSYVKTFVTMKNANPLEVKADTYTKKLNNMEVLIPVNLNGDNSFIFSSNKGNFQGDFTGGSENAYLFQSYSDEHQTDWPKDDCYDPNCMFDFVGEGFVVNHNNRVLNELGDSSEWTNSWAEINDSTGKGMTMAMQWMSGYWPAGFDLYGDGNASIEFFSKHAQYNTIDPLIFGYGKHETRTLMFDFHTSDINNELVIKRLEAPIIARNQLFYYSDTKVIYENDKIISVEEENQWRALHNLEPNSYDDSKEVVVWRLYWYSGVKGTDYEYKDIVNFLRTGQGKLFLNTEAITNFNADYAITRTDNWTRSELTSFDKYWSSKNKDIFQIGSFDRLHNHWLGMPIYYWLTGDERIREAILDYNELYRDKSPQNYNNVSDMRGLGRELRTMAYLYAFTNDLKTGEVLKQSVDSLLDSRDLEGNFWQGGRNLERGYLWQCHTTKHNPNRLISDFYITQIYSDACWCSYQILKNHDELNYTRIEELEDFQLGLAQFISKEMFFDDEHGFGYFYDYWLDKSNYYGAPNQPGVYIKRDSSRTMAFAYEQTGDESYLTIGERLLVAGVKYDTDMQRFHLMYDKLYKDNIDTWNYLNNVNIVDNGSNNYTLTWIVPEGAMAYKIKYSDKPIVDWLWFDQLTREYEYSPDEYIAFFAATNLDNNPIPLAEGAEQSVIIDVEQAITSYNAIRELTPDNPSYVTYDPDKAYYFDIKYNSFVSTYDPCEGVVCDNICVGKDLWSQKCDPATGNCVTDQLIEANSLTCGYVPPDPYIKLIDNGPPETHIDILLVGSGFISNEIDEFILKVDQNIEKTLSVNWFNDNSSLFNFWRMNIVSPESGVDIDDATIYSAASDVPYDILVVIHNYDCQESVQKPYVELCKYSHNYVVLAHELGHVIGRLDDEYYGPGTAYKCDGLSKRTLNIHDKPNNEKWSDLISTPPYEGARFCESGLWRPSEISIMKDAGSTPFFDAVGYKAMDLGAGKFLGTIESIRPSLQILGVQNDDIKSGILNAEAITEDATGIERVEFYWAKAGDTSKSIKIDKIYPYEISIDTTEYENGQYYLDTVSYDNNWNYTRVTTLFNIYNETNLCEGVVCDNICVGKDLWSQKCDPATGTCVPDQLIESNSSTCEYDPCEGVVCDNICVGDDLWSQGCNPDTGLCEMDQLLQQDSINCIIPDQIPSDESTIKTYLILGGIGVVALGILILNKEKSNR